MSKLNYVKCDECDKRIEISFLGDVTPLYSNLQMGDIRGYWGLKYDFCSLDCLYNFIKELKESQDAS